MVRGRAGTAAVAVQLEPARSSGQEDKRDRRGRRHSPLLRLPTLLLGVLVLALLLYGMQLTGAFTVADRASIDTTAAQQPAAGQVQPGGGLDLAALGRKHLLSRFASQLNASDPLPEYPRPQMQRARWLSLNGWWEWQEVHGNLSLGRSLNRRVLVPFAVEAPLSGLELRGAAPRRMRYRRAFHVPAEWRVCGEGGVSSTERVVDRLLASLAAHGGDGEAEGGVQEGGVLLHFGAVDWKADVFVNGQKAGSHQGGYAPFSLDITPLLRKGEARTRRPVQWLEVDVLDETEEHGQPVGKQRRDNPRNIWYTATSGIWQSVYLEPVPAAYISRLEIVPGVEGRGKGTVGAEVGVRLAACGAETEAGLLGCTAKLTRPNVALWSPQSPRLYGVGMLVRPAGGGAIIDEVSSYTAFRTVALRKGGGGAPARLGLNGAAYTMVGLLDQGYWPDGLYTAPTDEALFSDISTAKALGFNLLRKHAKVEPARWYYHCDRLGMLVWQDMPSPPALTCASAADGDPEWEGSDDPAKGSGGRAPACPVDGASFRQEMEALVASVGWAACVVLWVLFNEAWGQHAVAQSVAHLRSLDGGRRLLTDASGWLLSAHSVPPRLQPGGGGREDGERFWLDGRIRRCAQGDDCGDTIDVHAYPGPWPKPRHRARWYGHGWWDALRWGSNEARASVLGEFGGVSHRVPGHTQSDDGWGYTSAQGCDELLDTMTTLWRKTAAAGLSAAVYTQLSDVESELNGLLTYDRHLKCAPQLSAKLSPEIALVARGPGRRKL